MSNDLQSRAAGPPAYMWDAPDRADIKLGTGGADRMVGSAGADMLYGGKGSDAYDGGDGIDTVIFDQTFAAYRVSFDAASGGWVVQRGAERETLVRVEFLQFADRRIDLADPVLHQATQHDAVEAGGKLMGNDWGYFLSGGQGDDELIGNGGDDDLYGGKGSDTAVYRGPRADYVIEFNEQSWSYSVVDKQAARDGADTLRNIEWLQFADGRVAIDSVATVIPAPPVAPGQFEFIGDWFTSIGDPIYVDIVPGNAEAPALETVEGFVPTYSVIHGGAQDDLLSSTDADDQIYGGKGNDTVSYRGARSDYKVEFDTQTQRYAVVDSRPGRDGADMLHAIEWLAFADGKVAIDAVAKKLAAALPVLSTTSVLNVTLAFTTRADLAASDASAATPIALDAALVDLIGVEPTWLAHAFAP
jgi:Ca2+-binding RTX toxin-like protein